MMIVTTPHPLHPPFFSCVVFKMVYGGRFHLSFSVLLTNLVRDEGPEAVHVHGRAVELVLGLVEVTHTDLSEETRMAVERERCGQGTPGAMGGMMGPRQSLEAPSEVFSFDNTQRLSAGCTPGVWCHTGYPRAPGILFWGRCAVLTICP